MDFLNTLKQNFHKYRDFTALADEKTGKKITYGELDILSGKVCRYLKNQKIGREDIVMIQLPRGAFSLVAVIGAWRARAAVILLEADYPEKKRDVICKDADCRLIFGVSDFAGAMTCEYLADFEEGSEHDLCYLVYTSGSTGNPKGVMHEYGTLSLAAKSGTCGDVELFEPEDRFLYIQPMNFAAVFLLMIPCLSAGAAFFVAPAEAAKNRIYLEKIIKRDNITSSAFTSSMVRVMSKECRTPKMFLVAEPVKNICFEEKTCFCLYGQSESGHIVSSFLIDKEYDVTPLGKSCTDNDLKIVREDGKNAAIGEAGEICYRNPYLRGYLGLKDQTDMLLKNGIIHSGDIGKRLPDGNIIILVRNDDMVKINGNRIEPAEIEKAAKEVLGVQWAAAKAFTEKGRSYICLYYTEEPLIGKEEAIKELRKRLAYYMVPSFFRKIDEIPLNANGKFVRKDLKPPVIEEQREEYCAPINELEKKLCQGMEKVLGVSRVGRNEDFYEIGGDSLTSIELVSSLDLPSLSVQMIFEFRTPERIAEKYETVSADHCESPENRDEKARLTGKPLTDEQIYMIDHQLYSPLSVMWNVSMLLHFPKTVDVQRLKHALDRVMAAHPVFSTRFTFDDEFELVQKYDASLTFDIPVERITESEFIDIRSTLIRPFKLLNELMYRVRLFQTHRGGYLCLDMHHSVSDGSSMHILIRDIRRAYFGEEIARDYYYLYLEDRMKNALTENYRKGEEFNLKTFGPYKWTGGPKPDYTSGENIYENITEMIPIEWEDYDRLKEKSGLNRHNLFLLSMMIAVSAYNDERNVLLNWVFTGRGEKITQDIVGTLIKGPYTGLRFDENMTIRSAAEEILFQHKMGISYSAYSFSPENVYQTKEDAEVAFIYQSGIRSNFENNELGLSWVQIPDSVDCADALCEVEIHETKAGCLIYIDYNAARYKEESMKRFKNMIMKAACIIVENMDNQDKKIDEIRELLMRRVQNNLKRNK